MHSSLALVSLSYLLAQVSAKPSPKPYKHVAVFSVDGLHASDVPKYLQARPKSTIATLLSTGYLYPNANTTAPSDSFPGAVAQFTGAIPRISEIFYDVIFNRAVYPVGSNCKGPIGTEVADDESIDYNSTELFSGGINPALLPEYLVNGKCEKLYPHNRVKVNTAFEVVRSHGLETAYTDKHPAYDIMNGPSGKGLTVGYFPEIAAVNSTNLTAIIDYDKYHVAAFLDWLDAKTPTHSVGKLTKVPALFGGNFQAVSVAQKTVGYLEKPGNPFSPALLQALDFVDASLGKVVAKLKAKGLYDDTLIIVASKHGQAPINKKQYGTVNPDNVMAAAGVPVRYQTADDISLLFLNKSSDVTTAVKNLEKQKSALKIFQIYSEAKNVGLSLEKHNFGNPATNPAVPDIIVAPDVGIIYTTSTSKIAEHGGISNDDRNVACFVSSTRLTKKTINDHVHTTQIAPLILKALGFNPSALQGVVKGKVAVLPGF